MTRPAAAEQAPPLQAWDAMRDDVLLCTTVSYPKIQAADAEIAQLVADRDALIADNAALRADLSNLSEALGDIARAALGAVGSRT